MCLGGGCHCEPCSHNSACLVLLVYECGGWLSSSFADEVVAQCDNAHRCCCLELHCGLVCSIFLARCGSDIVGIVGALAFVFGLSEALADLIKVMRKEFEKADVFSS